MRQELELLRPNFNRNYQGYARQETTAKVPFSEKNHMGQYKRRTSRFRTSEGYFLPNQTKETVEANAETTILCTFGPCALSPNPTPGSVMPA